MRIAIALAALLFFEYVAQDETKCCETIEKAFYCRVCSKVLVDSEVFHVDLDKGESFYSCRTCAAKMEGIEGHYKAAVDEIELCVRTYYECAECAKFRLLPEECHGKAMTKRVHKARIQYYCDGCKRQWERPGVCASDKIYLNGKFEACSRRGDALERVCSCVRFPHDKDNKGKELNRDGHWSYSPKK